MAKLKIQKTGNIDVGIPAQTETGNIGVVGGANGLGAVSGGNTIACIANIEYDSGSYAAGDAFIVRQKGKSKFLVANTADANLTQICILANVDDGNVANLSAGQMAIQGVDAANANVAIFSIINSHAEGFAPDYVDANNIGNMANATAYHVSFVAANATLQPGSNLAIIQIPSQ